MAMDSKITLLNAIKDLSADILTQTQADRMMGLVADELARYKVEVVENEESKADDCLDAYLSAKAVEGRSEQTIERYRYLITRLMTSIKVQTREVTVFHLRKFLGDEKARGISDTSLEGMRQCYAAYFNWLHREGLIVHNPCANLGAIKCRKVVKRAYLDTEVEKLKRACCNLRDLAIICFLRATGCRVGEVVRLNRGDVDLAKGECKVLGKGNKERVVYFDSVTAMIIGDYLESRTDEYDALFPGNSYRNRSSRLSAQGIRKMLHTVQDMACVETNVHPHKFRRTLATGLIHHGMPIQEVAAILGHEKIDTTMRYVVIDKGDVKHHYNKYYA